MDLGRLEEGVELIRNFPRNESCVRKTILGSALAQHGFNAIERAAVFRAVTSPRTGFASVDHNSKAAGGNFTLCFRTNSRVDEAMARSNLRTMSRSRPRSSARAMSTARSVASEGSQCDDGDDVGQCIKLLRKVLNRRAAAGGEVTKGVVGQELRDAGFTAEARAAAFRCVLHPISGFATESRDGVHDAVLTIKTRGSRSRSEPRAASCRRTRSRSQVPGRSHTALASNVKVPIPAQYKALVADENWSAKALVPVFGFADHTSLRRCSLAQLCLRWRDANLTGTAVHGAAVQWIALQLLHFVEQTGGNCSVGFESVTIASDFSVRWVDFGASSVASCFKSLSRLLFKLRYDVILDSDGPRNTLNAHLAFCLDDFVARLTEQQPLAPDRALTNHPFFWTWKKCSAFLATIGFVGLNCASSSVEELMDALSDVKRVDRVTGWMSYLEEPLRTFVRAAYGCPPGSNEDYKDRVVEGHARNSGYASFFLMMCDYVLRKVDAPMAECDAAALLTGLPFVVPTSYAWATSSGLRSNPMFAPFLA